MADVAHVDGVEIGQELDNLVQQHLSFGRWLTTRGVNDHVKHRQIAYGVFRSIYNLESSTNLAHSVRVAGVTRAHLKSSPRIGEDSSSRRIRERANGFYVRPDLRVSLLWRVGYVCSFRETGERNEHFLHGGRLRRGTLSFLARLFVAGRMGFVGG